MRVLHVDPARTWRGGERQVLLLARELARRGHDSVVAGAPDGELLDRVRAAGLPTLALGVRGDLDARAILRGTSALRRLRPDVLHLHTARAHAVGGLAARLARQRPVLVTRRVELPIVGPFSRWKYRHLADHYIAISGAVEEALIRGGVAPGRITRIPSGIELPPAERSPRAGPVRRVGTLAAFSRQKDPGTWLRTVIRVCRADRSVRFVWAGQGELEGEVKVGIERAGLSSRVDLPGFLANPGPLWEQLDAFFLPSSFEALGTTLLDALARGIPVVATQVGGIPEIVRPEREGLLAPVGDDGALAAALLRLVREPELAARLGQAGRERAADFEIGGIVDRIVKLYDRLVEEGA